MRAPNHVDARRRLLPRDYLAEPARFGQDLDVALVLPADGDRRSARIARFQHHLAFRWQQADRRRSASALAREYDLSPQVVTRSLRGERWMGETVLCALAASLASHTAEVNRPASS